MTFLVHNVDVSWEIKYYHCSVDVNLTAAFVYACRLFIKSEPITHLYIVLIYILLLWQSSIAHVGCLNIWYFLFERYPMQFIAQELISITSAALGLLWWSWVCPPPARSWIDTYRSSRQYISRFWNVCMHAIVKAPSKHRQSTVKSPSKHRQSTVKAPSKYHQSTIKSP